MVLNEDEIHILVAAVHAEEAGGDPHEAARDATPGMDRDRFNLILQRLKDAGYLDAMLSRDGSGKIYAAHIHRVLPRGVDAARTGRVSEYLEPTEIQLVERIIGSLLELSESDELELDNEGQADLEAQIATVVAQSKSPRPRRRIVVESLKTIRNIIEGAAGSVLAAAALNLIGQIG